jgi:DNA replication protein DnaC
MESRLDIKALLKDWQMASAIQRHCVVVPFEDVMSLIWEIGRRLCPDFSLDGKNGFVYRNIALWMLGSQETLAQDASGQIVRGDITRGLYLAGPTGTGKTLCMRVFHNFAKCLGLNYTIGDKLQYIDLNFYRADLICDDYAKEGDLQKFKQMPILSIEDLGSENQETLYMGNRRNVIQSILEARGDRPLQLTNITSNIPIEHLGDTYGDRVQSRAYSMFNYYILSGSDRRK